MAKFTTDATLAAMTQRAHSILSGRQLAAGAGGGTVPNPVKPTPPTQVLQQMAAAQKARAGQALQGLMGRFSGANDAIRPNPYRALTHGEVVTLARLAAMKQEKDMGGLDKNPAYVTDEIARAANDPANAGIWTAHQIAQEGVHTDPNGQRYVMVKYVRPGVGSDTRRVNLP